MYGMNIEHAHDFYGCTWSQFNHMGSASTSHAIELWSLSNVKDKKKGLIKLVIFVVGRVFSLSDFRFCTKEVLKLNFFLLIMILV